MTEHAAAADNPQVDHDVLIVGAGPVGLALALALSGCGLDIVLADARPPKAAQTDPRTLALAHGSRLSLEQLGAWAALPVTPIESIHVSQHGGFGRTVLEAQEQGVDALGYVTSAGALAATLRAAVDAAGIRVLHETEVGALVAGADSVRAALAGAGAPAAGLRFRLVACAEGGMREGERKVVDHDYHQHALIARIEAEGGHQRRAFERFTASGPLALLPDGDAFAMVHVVAAEAADALLALDDAAYLQYLHAQLGERLRLRAVGQRLRYPLRLRYRTQTTAARTVWLGNAAQTLHPVAGQGFNLALRDVMELARCVREHLRRNDLADRDPGAPAVLSAYERARRLDRQSTIRFTDGLVRVFSNDFAPLRHARGAALLALDLLPPLRGFLARRMLFGARAWP